MEKSFRGQSVTQFADSLSVSRAFIYRAVQQGWGPALTKLGKRTVILREDGDAFGQRIKNTSPKRY